MTDSTDSISEGPFASVRTEQKNGKTVVIKQARKEAADVLPQAVASRAIMFVTGGVMEVKPNCNELIETQSRMLRSWRDIPGVVKAEPAKTRNGNVEYEMEYLEGRSARELFVTGEFSVDMFLELLETIKRIQKKTPYDFHGDLKPENIICTADGVKVIDPGHFGPLDTQFGRDANVPVTTPAYYPYLKPDDTLALGVLLWECLLFVHPFAPSEDQGEYDETRVDKSLINKVLERQRVGQHFLKPMLTIPLPRELNVEISEEMEQFLLNALRIEKNEKTGKLAAARGFNTVAELANELLSVQDRGKLFWRS